MFVPSESIFAEIHENFEAIVQQGAPRPRRHRLAVAADAVDPGHPGDPQGCAHARAGASDPGRGRPADGGRLAASTSACASCRRISARPTRTSTTSSSRPARSAKRGQKIEALEFGAGRREDDADGRAAGAAASAANESASSAPRPASCGCGWSTKATELCEAGDCSGQSRFLVPVELRQPRQRRAVPDLAFSGPVRSRWRAVPTRMP